MKTRLTMLQACAILDEYAASVGSVMKPWGATSEALDEHLFGKKRSNRIALPDDFPDWSRERQEAYLEEKRTMMSEFVEYKKALDAELAADKREGRKRFLSDLIVIFVVGIILLGLLFIGAKLGIFGGGGFVPCTRGTPHGC